MSFGEFKGVLGGSGGVCCTAMMSYDFKMSSDYNHDVLKL